MRLWLRSQLTYANVISTLCLFLLLGGGTAVALNGSNTVFSDDITDNQVFGADVRNDTLAGGGLGAADLKPASVGTSEVAANSLTGGDINESSLGTVPNADQFDGVDSSGFLGASAKAADSDQLDGKNSTDFLTHHLNVQTADTSLPAGSSGNNTASCANGKLALGGGVELLDPVTGDPTFHSGSPVLFSRPHTILVGGVVEPRGWEAAMKNGLLSTATMRIWVICET